MKIIVENSTWNNVGDGWYQFSLYYMLKSMYPNYDVVLGEGPVKRSFRISKQRQLSNALDWMQYQKGDIHVFSGPMMSQIDSGSYADKIKEIMSRNANYVLISASGTNLSEKRKLEIFAFLKKYPPLFFSSRDLESFNNFSPIITNSYNGICTAFLVDLNIKLKAYTMDKPFFISSFYTELEPVYRIKDGLELSISTIDVKHRNTILGLPFKVSRHLNFLLNKQDEICGCKIVRTIQNLNTKFNHINFAMPNSFISFNPISYLELAKSAEFTISDRVHACAISLACNKPARFLFDTPRAGIFDRLGFDYKSNNGVMYPNMDILIKERELLIAEIKKYI